MIDDGAELCDESASEEKMEADEAEAGDDVGERYDRKAFTVGNVKPDEADLCGGVIILTKGLMRSIVLQRDGEI